MMKNLQTFVVLGLLALLTSCGGAETATKNKSMGNNSNTNGAVYNADVNSNSNSRKPDIDKSATATVNRDSNDWTQKNSQDMYDSLGMNEDQIKQFEKASNASMDSWHKKNPNKSMNNYEMQESRDQVIKPILTESQYTQYQQWTRDNASRQ